LTHPDSVEQPPNAATPNAAEPPGGETLAHAPSPEPGWGQQWQTPASPPPYAPTPQFTATYGQEPASPYAPAAPYLQSQHPYHPHPYAPPGMSDGPGAGLTHRRRPFTIWLASLLMWPAALLVVLGGVGVIVVSVMAGGMVMSELAEIPGMRELRAGLTTLAVAVGAGMIVGGVLYGALSIASFRGSNPMRWVLVVLLALSALGWIPVVALLITNVEDLSIVAVTSVPFLLLLLLVLLYLLPPAGTWYRYRGNVKAQQRMVRSM